MNISTDIQMAAIEPKNVKKNFLSIFVYSIFVGWGVVGAFAFSVTQS